MSSPDVCVADRAGVVEATVGSTVGSDHLPVFIHLNPKLDVERQECYGERMLLPTSYTKTDSFLDDIHSLCNSLLNRIESELDWIQPTCGRSLSNPFVTYTTTIIRLKKRLLSISATFRLHRVL